jgi:uroporphyrinogen decarboxylase
MMNSRERIRRFLAGQKVDRIPVGLGACETAGLHNLAYDTLKCILGVEDPRNRMTTFMTTALVEPEVQAVLGGDLVFLGTTLSPAPFFGPHAAGAWKEQVLWGRRFQVPVEWNYRRDPDGTVRWDAGNGRWEWKCPPDGLYFDLAPTGPLAEALLTAERPRPEEYCPPHSLPEGRLRVLEESARWLYENTELGIVCGEFINDLQLAPGGKIAWWMRLVEEPQAAHEFLGRAVEAGLDQLRELDQAVGKYADILQIGDDIGDSRGVTIGPELWREIYKPHYQDLFTAWRRITRMKVSMHSCGSVADILGDLIECGVQIYNPVQVSARNMEPEKLKVRFGDRLIFYGGAFDAVQTPPHTSPEVVYEKVKANIRALSAGGGYLFAGVHNIPGDTPEAHLRAILAAYNDCKSLPECL